MPGSWILSTPSLSPLIRIRLVHKRHVRRNEDFSIIRHHTSMDSNTPFNSTFLDVNGFAFLQMVHDCSSAHLTREPTIFQVIEET